MKLFFRDSRRAGFAFAIFCAVIFGYWPVAVRGIYADGGNVVFTLLVLSWIRAVTMTGYCLVMRQPMFRTREDRKQGIIGGFSQAICVIALYTALLFLPGPIVIITLFSHTLMLLFYMAWRGEIKLDRFTVATTLIALAGLSMVLDLWHHQPITNIWGIALAFVGALATVSRLYVYGHQTKARHPMVVGAENYLLAAVFTTVVLFYGMPQAPIHFSGMAYAVTGSLAVTFGTIGMLYGISMLGSFQWSLFAKLEPVCTAVFSALFLGEILKPGQYLGIFVVTGSLVIYQIVEHRRKMVAMQQDTVPLQ